VWVLQEERHVGGRASAPVSEQAVQEPRVTLLSPLRNRDFSLLVTGQTLSTFGDMMFLVVFPFLVIGGKGGVGELGLVMAVLGVSRLAASPLGGILADRWHPRLTMLAADVGRAITLLWLARTIGSGQVATWQFAIVAVILGALEGMFLPAYRAITPAVLPGEQAKAGYSLGEALNVVAAIAGQLTAGLALTVFGKVGVLEIDIATFIASAVTMLVIRGTRPHPVARDDQSHAETKRAGHSLRAFVLSSRLFMLILLMTAMASITATGLFAVGLPVLARRGFANGAEAYGIFLVAMSVGRLVGALAAGQIVGARRRGVTTLSLLIVHGVALVLVTAIGGLAALVPTLAILGLADGTLAVVVVTMTQQLAPPAILGRAMGALTLVQMGSYPASVALAGVAIALLGLGPTFVIGGIGVVAVGLFGFSQRVIRDA
jgi:MFS transporter, DHA3 family, tetracycline resistance protein